MKICVFGGGSLYRLPVYNLMARELDCDFFISAEDPTRGIKTYDETKLLNYRGTLSSYHLLGNFYWLKNAVSLINKPYDLYIVGGPFCISYWFMIILSKFNKKKVASWSHGIYGKEKRMRKFIKSMYFKFCDMNFVYNDRAKSLMVQVGVNERKIASVGNSLDTESNLLIRKSLAKSNIFKEYFQNDNPNLIYVGRVTKEKRLDMLLDAMEILYKKGIFLNLIVIGKDVDGVNLNDLIKERNLDRFVYLFGPCYDERLLGNLFYNADICVSPGNIGLTAISAMTFGCPVISHGNFNFQGPESAAIKPGITGDFFIHNDVNDLARVIKNWIENSNEQKREQVRKDAMWEVDSKWNIYSEVESFKNALSRI